MKIVSVETFKIPPSWVWVCVKTDEGIEGWGEPYLEIHPDTLIAEVNRLAPYILDKDPTEIENRWYDMYDSGMGYVGGPVKLSAVSGIDMALWDIKGKALGVPVYRLLGGPTNTKIKVYRSVEPGTPRCVEPGEHYSPGVRPAGGARRMMDINTTPQAYADCAEQLVEWGYRGMKMHVHVDIKQQKTVDIIAKSFEAIRKRVGDDIDLMIDVHNPVPEMAVKLAKLLEPYNLLFMEEPAPIERIGDIAKVAEKMTVPIAAGERWTGKWEHLRSLEAGTRIVQPDTAHAGGITELKKIASMAEAFKGYIAPHNPLSILSFVASCQLDAGVPNFLIQEHNNSIDTMIDGKLYIGGGYLKEPYLLKDGVIELDEKPGLGFVLDEEGMKAIKAKPWTVRRG